jgi:hypothetical protein
MRRNETPWQLATERRRPGHRDQSIQMNCKYISRVTYSMIPQFAIPASSIQPILSQIVQIVLEITSGTDSLLRDLGGCAFRCVHRHLWGSLSPSR